MDIYVSVAKVRLQAHSKKLAETDIAPLAEHWNMERVYSASEHHEPFRPTGCSRRLFSCLYSDRSRRWADSWLLYAFSGEFEEREASVGKLE